MERKNQVELHIKTAHCWRIKQNSNPHHKTFASKLKQRKVKLFYSSKTCLSVSTRPLRTDIGAEHADSTVHPPIAHSHNVVGTTHFANFYFFVHCMLMVMRSCAMWQGVVTYSPRVVASPCLWDGLEHVEDVQSRGTGT